jgi:D-sedoheptulose 7-phosphate isomerase
MGTPSAAVAERLLGRNAISRRFFAREAQRLARSCRDMAARLARGGRLVTFGVGNALSDAQHVAVEFVHPVIVGKRALPALDVSQRYCESISVLTRADDVVMAFDLSGSDPNAARALATARARGAQTFALAGAAADYAIDPADTDPFVHQEIVEILYHVLWETVHVFLEHAHRGHDAGRAGFLYPFLGSAEQDTERLVEQVASSIQSKAAEDERLRQEVADRDGGTIAAAADAVYDRLVRGGKLLLLGNGGSATDATDWALDCVASPKGRRGVPAISLSADPATMTAIANDVGHELVFVRQVIAHAHAADVVIVLTTSGGSANIVAALEEARRRGLLTIALTGNRGGEIARRELADFQVVVPSDYIPRIQEVHASVYHVMTDFITARAIGA